MTAPPGLSGLRDGTRDSPRNPARPGPGSILTETGCRLNRHVENVQDRRPTPSQPVVISRTAMYKAPADQTGDES